MAQYVEKLIAEFWFVLASMAPYLLFGFLIASVLSVFLKASFVRERFGKGGFREVVVASLMGVPLPLCSCGVLPVAASLREQGATRGATLSFLTSTPQTGVDSIAITYSLLGPIFTIVKVGVAFVSGVFCGSLVDRFGGQDPTVEDRRVVEPSSIADSVPLPKTVRLRHGLRHGFVTVACSIAWATLIGVFLAAVLTTFIPPNLLTGIAEHRGWTMFAMLVVGIPLYVCSSGSVPLAYAFMATGISPGAALVFLIVGPATNMATVTTVWKLLGGRSVLLYLGSLTFCAILAGYGFDFLLLRSGVESMPKAHGIHLGFWSHVSAVVLLVVFATALANRRKAKNERSEGALT
ncbi:MAG: permease [Kiritimatiellae bacterium]|nr:permease [Kiritimatiellia bacterium]